MSTWPSSGGPVLATRADPPGWLCWLSAVALCVLVATVWALLGPRLGSGFNALLGYPTVALVAWYAGAGPALLATALMALAGAVVIDTPTPAPGEWLRLTVFVGSGVLIAALAESMHRARRAALA